MSPRESGAATVRPLHSEEQELLTRATLGAFIWNGPLFTLEDLERTPNWARYFTAWPRSRDFGLVAEDASGAALAATWW